MFWWLFKARDPWWIKEDWKPLSNKDILQQRQSQVSDNWTHEDVEQAQSEVKAMTDSWVLPVNKRVKK